MGHRDNEPSGYRRARWDGSGWPAIALFVALIVWLSGILR